MSAPSGGGAQAPSVPGVRGYTRAEAVASVGPGWADLAGRAWDIASVAKIRVVQVKEKWARLVVYTDVAGDRGSVNAQRLYAQLQSIEEESTRVCEACGRPGRVWGETDEERACIAAATGRSWIWLRTLCADCGYRHYYEGARGWAEIRGEWHPEVDDDGEPGEEEW